MIMIYSIYILGNKKNKLWSFIELIQTNTTITTNLLRVTSGGSYSHSIHPLDPGAPGERLYIHFQVNNSLKFSYLHRTVINQHKSQYQLQLTFGRFHVFLNKDCFFQVSIFKPIKALRQSFLSASETSAYILNILNSTSFSNLLQN